jgi:hypothetical protein
MGAPIDVERELTELANNLYQLGLRCAQRKESLPAVASELFAANGILLILAARIEAEKEVG